MPRFSIMVDFEGFLAASEVAEGNLHAGEVFQTSCTAGLLFSVNP
jgi:hypothetical protein